MKVDEGTRGFFVWVDVQFDVLYQDSKTISDVLWRVRKYVLGREDESVELL